MILNYAPRAHESSMSWVGGPPEGLQHTDIMVANDIEMFDRTDICKMSKLKHLLIPNGIHKGNSPKRNISYENVINKLTGVFTGNLIVYNLKSSKKNEKFIDLNSMCSSSNTAADLIGQYMHNIQRVTFYGVGVLENGSGYANVFPETEAMNDYSPFRVKGIRNTAIKSLEGKEIAFL